MLIYLDNCSIQRPLDDRSQIRIAVETECVLGLLALVERQAIQIVSSEALAFEVQNNTDVFRRTHALEVLARASTFVEITDAIEARASELDRIGLGPLDALHLACAEAGGAAYFCTCDDDIVRKAKRATDLRTKVVTPVDLVEELDQ